MTDSVRERHQCDAILSYEANIEQCLLCRKPWPCDGYRADEWQSIAKELAEALAQATERIHVNEDAMGHSYCANHTGDYTDPCTCGYEDEMDAAKAALARYDDAAGERP